MPYFHSVTLYKDKCHGCTNCIKNCPTEAIRVRGGKAKIIKERCIDCGECIRICPYHAKRAVTDSIEELKAYKYNIAITAPSFYGQFEGLEDRNRVLTALTEIGFDDCFEVSIGAEYATEATKRILEKKRNGPLISSACPAVVRLIRERFPDLLDNLSPVLSPMEISAVLARKRAKEKTSFSDDEIGVFFITPCPAKVTSIKNPLSIEKSYVSGAFSAAEIYLKIRSAVKNPKEVKSFINSGINGISWAKIGGEASGTENPRNISVDGIKNVIGILEELEDGKLENIDFAELCACPGGCVGGALNVSNPFIASNRIKNMIAGEKTQAELDETEIKLMQEKKIMPARVMLLDEDFEKAMEKMERLEKIYSEMPKLDCGSCGAPSCRALAEDIVRGFADKNDCIFKMREKVKELAKELFELEERPYGNNSEQDQ